MAWDSLSVSLRNDTGSPIVLGSLSIAAAGSEPIWDTVDYAAGVIDNFAQVLVGIATFNQEIQAANLVMVVNAVDQSVSEAFAQFAELTDVYNELEEARREFSRLRLSGESTLGLDIVGPGGVDVGALPVLQQEPSGFKPAGYTHPSTLSRVDGTLTFSIAPTGADFDYYVQGKKFTVSSQQDVNWTDVEGQHFFYFDSSGVLQHTTDTAVVEGVIQGDGALVSYLYWDATNNISTPFEERHGLQMDGGTHFYLHRTRGARLISGGALGDLVVDGDGSSDTHCQFSVGATTIVDEDIELKTSETSQQLSVPAQIDIYYLLGASADWRQKARDNFPFIWADGVTWTDGSGRPAYNQFTGGAWQLSVVPDNDYFLVHYFAVGGLDGRIIGILGQALYATAPQARAGAETELGNLLGIIRLFSLEAVPIATVIYHGDTSFTNTTQTRIVSATDGDYVNWTQASLPSGAAATVHANLAGLTGSDDHTQYALLAGRAGGQTLIGGTAAGDDLTLQSTSNALRGNVFVPDNELRIRDNGDPTRLLAFQLSAITTATTRTITMADADVNLADVGLNNSHRTNTSNPHSTTLANLTDTDLTGIAQGNILYRNATQWVVLPPGTAGQLLQSGGAGANPSWTTASGTGDVVGPASSVDYALAVFNGTTGKLLREVTGVATNASGHLFSEQYIMGSGPDMSLIPVSGGQSVVTSWHGLQLVGNKQSTVQYTPANVGTNNQFGVLVPSQDIDADASFAIIGATSQTGDLMRLLNSTLSTVLFGVTIGGALRMNLVGTPPSHSEGLVWYDSTAHALVAYNDVSATMQQLGQEHYKRVHNATGALLANGSVVYTTGTVTSGVPNVALAQADAYTTAYAVGVLTHDIANGADGYATQFGNVTMDTSALSIGKVYLSPTVAGGLTNTPPTGSNIRVEVGEVITVGASGVLAAVLPHALPLDSNKALNLPGDLTVSTNGATLASPRIVGGADLTSGEGMRYQFGDANNGWQNGFDQAMQMWAYHSIILIGDKNSLGAPTMETTSNIGVIVRNSTTTSTALAVDGAASQTAALQQWRTSAGTMLAQVTAGGTYDANNHDVDNIKVAAFNGIIAHGSMGTTETFDWTQGNKHSATNSAACTISFTAPPGPTVLHLILTNGGAFALTWPASVDWAGGSPPTLTASGVDIIAFLYDGTTYYGQASKNFN